MEHRTIFLIAALLLILLGAGCMTNSPQGQNTTPSPVPSDTGTGIPATETIDAHFSTAPLALPQQEQFAGVMGSFDDTYLGSMDCSNGSETFETNYTYFSGAGSPRTVTYQLVPVNYVQSTDEAPLPAGILNATIEPDRFTAEPYHAYTSRVRITVGPNVTGFSSQNFVQNPAFPFYLKVQGDGAPEPGANDWVEVVKICYIHPGLGSMMWSDPRFSFGNPQDISLRPGGSTSVPLTISDSGGGIREEYFRIGRVLTDMNYSFPFPEEEFLPNPQGIQFSLDPPQVIGRSFTLYNLTLTVTAPQDITPGTYHFPLELCYRDLASPDNGSGQDPFENRSNCDTGTVFPVNITG